MSEILKQQLDDIDARLQCDTFYPAIEDQIRSLYRECKAAKYSEGILRTEQHLVNIEDQAGHFDEAEKLNTKVKRAAKKNGLYRVYHECVYYEIVRSLRGGDPKASYPLAQQLLAEAEKIGDTYAIANTRFLTGIISRRYGFDNEAIGFFKQALNISQEYRYLIIKANILNQLSELFLTKLQVTQAEQYASECLSIYQSLGDSSSVLRIKIRLVSICEQSDLTKMEVLLREMQNLSDSIKGPALGTFYVLKGNYYARKEGIDQAQSHYIKALEIFAAFRRPRLEMNVYGILSTAYLKAGNNEESLSWTNKMLSNAERLNDGYHLTQSYYQSYLAYKNLGDIISSFNYLERYNERLKAEEEQLLSLRLEFIELQKDFDMKRQEASDERQRATLLQIELEHKERELTEKTRHLIKQTDALSQFRDDLRAIIRRSPSDDPLIQEIKERVKSLPESQLSWQQFDEQFKSVHPTFHSKLLGKYPKLTKMEQKVCALLRLNMTSIDIAKLLFLSERNIENHRYRIRKKIALNTEESLQEYLMKF